MHKLFSTLLLLTVFVTYSQSNTDVFLFDLKISNNSIELLNHRNISSNDGYDNQPSFLDDNTILYAGTRNGQTDIVKYSINYDSKIFVNHTEGGEYSPLKIPNKREVSAVRLDKDGKQRLYAYNLRNGESVELIQDLVVAYYTWFDANTIVAAVIEEDGLNLFVINVKDGTSKKYQSKVGRSFHKIPNSNLVSFISKENDVWQIKSLNPKNGATKVIANTIKGIEDICWLNSKTILSGKESTLYKLTLQKDNNWKQVEDLSSKGISKITRLATNPEATMLLIAGDINENEKVEEEKKETKNNEAKASNEMSEAEGIVQKQLDAYNNRDIDAFMATYTKDIKLYNYPNQLQTDGQEQMRKSYEQWFKQTPDLRAFIKKRIVIGNKVIDEEQVTANGQVFNAVAIYEVENGLIKKVTFIQ
ncbi:nuclear transport factor 2 family protein [Pontimicrobium sp. SW4]|uniref:Nuclear transport factor 2 family protein n=1 Tax=Pontimicrobium sp. SW4 TaxID=3153519 RepID=A0AAU7BVT5_9FLAO